MNADPPIASQSLRLHVRALAGRRYSRFVANHLRKAWRMVDAPLEDLSLVLVGDKRMSDLHRRYMNIPGPTDVLSFELQHDARGRCVAGELILCVPEAARNARTRGHGTEVELLLYAVHGLLHLSGWDDRTRRAYDQMHRLEDDILTRLGIGPAFHCPARQAGGVGA